MKGLQTKQSMLLKSGMLKMAIGIPMLYGSSYIPMPVNGFLIGAGMGMMFIGIGDFVKASDVVMEKEDKEPEDKKTKDLQ